MLHFKHVCEIKEVLCQTQAWCRAKRPVKSTLSTGGGCRDWTPGQNSSAFPLQTSPSLCTCMHTSPDVMSQCAFEAWSPSGLCRNRPWGACVNGHLKAYTPITTETGDPFGVNAL